MTGGLVDTPAGLGFGGPSDADLVFISHNFVAGIAAALVEQEVRF